METTSKLGMTLYNSNDTTTTWPDYVDSIADAFQKIDDAYHDIDDTLTQSGEFADAKAVGDEFSDLMLKSVYDPDSKEEDPYPLIETAALNTDKTAWYIILWYDEGFVGGTYTITSSDGAEVISGVLTNDSASITANSPYDNYTTTFKKYSKLIQLSYGNQDYSYVVSKRESNSYYVSPTTYTGSIYTFSNQFGVKSYYPAYNPKFNVSTTLNNNTWQEIAMVADSGRSETGNYWNIGDRKSLTLNGTTYGITESSSDYITYSSVTTYAFIIGFNYTSNYETHSSNIIFMIGEQYYSNGVIKCAWGSYPITLKTSFSGGWSETFIYNKILCSGIAPSNATSYSFTAMLPTSLKAYIKAFTCVTSNAEDRSAALNISATQEYVTLPSASQVYGTDASGYVYALAETQKQGSYIRQPQFDYFGNGNSKQAVVFNSSSSAYWWLRSPSSKSTQGWCYVDGSGKLNYTTSTSISSSESTQYYIRPIFAL